MLGGSCIPVHSICCESCETQHRSTNSGYPDSRHFGERVQQFGTENPIFARCQRVTMDSVLVQPHPHWNESTGGCQGGRGIHGLILRGLIAILVPRTRDLFLFRSQFLAHSRSWFPIGGLATACTSCLPRDQDVWCHENGSMTDGRAITCTVW